MKHSPMNCHDLQGFFLVLETTVEGRVCINEPSLAVILWEYEEPVAALGGPTCRFPAL